jgi:hypothetical protein
VPARFSPRGRSCAAGSRRVSPGRRTRTAAGSSDSPNSRGTHETSAGRQVGCPRRPHRVPARGCVDMVGGRLLERCLAQRPGLRVRGLRLQPAQRGRASERRIAASAYCLSLSDAAGRDRCDLRGHGTVGRAAARSSGAACGGGGPDRGHRSTRCSPEKSAPIDWRPNEQTRCAFRCTGTAKPLPKDHAIARSASGLGGFGDLLMKYRG